MSLRAVPGGVDVAPLTFVLPQEAGRGTASPSPFQLDLSIEVDDWDNLSGLGDK